MDDDLTPVDAARLARQRATEAARSAGIAPEAAAGGFTTLAEGGTAPDVATLYARLISTAADRAQLYGAQLAAAWAEAGVDAVRVQTYVVDPATGELHAGGESVTALARLEAEERRALERLITQGARLSLEERAAQALQRNGVVLVEALRSFAESAGLDWSSPDVRRALQKALLAARARAEVEAS